MKIKDTYTRLYGVIFSAYVGSGPIYWIPWVNIKVIDVLKYTLFFVIVLWPIIVGSSFSKFQFPGGKKALLLFVGYFLLSIPSLLQGEQVDSTYRLLNTIQIFLFLFGCGFLIHKKIIKSVVHLSVRIFIFFCILSLFLMQVIPDYVSPLNDGLYLSQTGLGGSRTGWSPSIALFLPWLYSGFVISSGFWLWVAAFSMVANQILVAGRTGMVAALIPFLFYGVFRKSIKVLVLVVIVVGVFGLFAINNLELLRLDVGGFGNRADLDELSTGRTGNYARSIDEIASNPVAGYGTGSNGSLGVHNIILRSAMEGGVFYSFIIIVLLFFGLYRGWIGMAKRDWFVASAFMTVLSGVVTSFFEPLAMFGSFNSAGFWWLCFAVCVSFGQQRPYKSTRR